MANNRWTGEAVAVAQVDTYTPGGTIEADDIFILTVNGYDGSSVAISAAAGGTAVADVTDAVTTAWNASTNALCTGITAADNTTNLTLTADTAGVAFSITQTTTEAGGGGADDQTFAKASTTANVGPKDWSSVDNWSLGTVPDTDDAYLDNWSGDILYGLDQSGVTALASLNVHQTFTGNIGVNGAVGYNGTYLQIPTVILNIGDYEYSGNSKGPVRGMFDLGSATACQITQISSGTATDTGKPAIRIKAANDATDIAELRKGTMGVAVGIGETSKIGTVLVSYNTRVDSDAELILGSGIDNTGTKTAVRALGGKTTVLCQCVSVQSTAGTMVTEGSGAIATMTVDGGIVTSNSTGTIAACNITAGTCDFLQSQEARTVTTLKLDPPGTLKIDDSVIVLTNGITPVTDAKRIQYKATDA